ncbi:HET domain-containing protein, partial [Candidatus Bathyarchaeota archaeon]|nr:HET domain-containing protein [Candidatus Bathyarchaeota archaeon]
MFFTNRLSQSTKCAETFSLARKWIASCTAKHERCNAGAGETGWYPTRLLDCGTSEDPETCRLVETETTTIEGPYTTLSHCWGLADCLKLTIGNRDQFLDRIPFSLLPQLYQDAVHVTRNLGVRYLWIDSIC